MRESKEMNLGGSVGRDKLGGAEGGETIIRMYYVKGKTSTFSERKKDNGHN